jgi:hypothetical protein
MPCPSKLPASPQKQSGTPASVSNAAVSARQRYASGFSASDGALGAAGWKSDAQVTGSTIPVVESPAFAWNCCTPRSTPPPNASSMGPG